MWISSRLISVQQCNGLCTTYWLITWILIWHGQCGNLPLTMCVPSMLIWSSSVFETVTIHWWLQLSWTWCMSVIIYIRRPPDIRMMRSETNMDKNETLLYTPQVQDYEKDILVQLKDCITSHIFITCCQSAFRKNHSTTTALHRVICDVLDGISENDITTTYICFIDLQKCFNTIVFF